MLLMIQILIIIAIVIKECFANNNYKKMKDEIRRNYEGKKY